ncbi:TRAP transporter small permease subunit [Pelagibius sp. Alg239-R121]|uniref:TRAP transporter small permease subunit n=1 Tax=Pelagibius sp. Alg239-R121 TaxID=2993448 RepID=UPI0024A739D4|nr:TRAP transporter small permease [Pelagibius sp. Alg239-R121]
MVEHEITSWMDRVSIAISRVTMFIVAFIVAIMFYEVVVRYVFSSPTLWVNEMSLWVAGAVYLLAGLYVMQQRAHIRIFMLYDLVPRAWQRFFDVISTLFICIFSAAVVWGGFNESLAKVMRWEKFGTAWDPPIPATMKPLILITVVLIAVQAVTNLISDWHKEKEVHAVVDDL